MPSPGFTAFTASNIQDASGTPLASGSLLVQPTDANNLPITARSGGAGGQMIVAAANWPITVGSIGAGKAVADTALTTPTNISYRITVLDPQGRTLAVHKGVQPNGSTFNFDTYSPNVPAQAPYVLGGQGPQGNAGTNGTNGTNGQVTNLTLSTAVSTLALSVLPAPVNLFDQSKMVFNFYYNVSGVPTPYGGYNHSGLIFAPGATQFVANFDVRSDSYARVALFDSTGAYMGSLPIAGNGVAYPARTPITLPGTQTYFIVNMLDLSGLATDMVSASAGTASLPGAYVSFGPNPASVEAANIAAAVSASAATLTSQITAVRNAGIIAAQALAPVAQNLFDINKMSGPNLLINGSGPNAGQLTTLAGYTSSGLVNVFGLANVSANFGFGAYQDHGVAFYDAALNFLSGLTGYNAGLNNTSTQTIAVPAGACYMRFYFGTLTLPGGGAQGMIVAGTVAPSSLASGFVPFNGNPNTVVPTSAYLTTAVSALGWAGKNVAWIGDSISTYRNGPTPKVLTMLGLNQSYKTAKVGRFMWNAFEATGAGWPTPTAFLDGTITNVAPTAASFTSADLIVLFLGTNISDRANLGTLDSNGEYSIANDPPLAVFPCPSTTPLASFASQLAGVIAQLLTWNPSARIVWVTPYQSGNPNPFTVVQIGKAVCRYYSIPLVDLFNESGINALTIPLYLTSDTVHPLQIGLDNAISPLIARVISNHSLN